MSDNALSFDRDRTLRELVRFRRDLHRIPELDFELPQTVSYIEGVLAGLRCEASRPCPSCVCAYFDAGAPRTTAIRADMDALPVTEATGVDFASGSSGRMHACGHDAHMAMALAAACEVDRALGGGATLPANVLFVFQPAEETTGGAKTVCESGVFERYGVDRIFGFHVWPDLPWGTVASRPGALLARSSETHIRIHGKSTHIAKTYGVSDVDSHDAALAAARFVVSGRWAMSRLGQEEPCIAKFGLLQAGTVCNAVAAEAHIAGSLRVFSDGMFERAKAEISKTLDEACASTGCTGEVEFAEGYPPVTNDPALFDEAAAALPGLERIDEPLLIAEDFSFYQQRMPGVFFLLGVGAPREGGEAACGPLGCAHAGLHADTLMFDESVLLNGVAAYRALLGLPA